MRSAPRVLRLFADRAKVGRLVIYQDVARLLDITDQAAVDALIRLWRSRLIRPLGPSRRRGFTWRPEEGEQVGELWFRITPRGEERLRWFAQQGRSKDGGWPGSARTASR